MYVCTHYVTITEEQQGGDSDNNDNGDNDHTDEGVIMITTMWR